MWLSRGGRVWLLSLWPMLAGATEPPSAGNLPPPLTSVPLGEAWHSLARLEVTTLAQLPHAGLGADEGFAQVEPTLIIDGGVEFGLNLGAPVRLRLWGGQARGEQVRRKDWDSLSDWGQLVRGLKLGSEHTPVGVWLGGLEDYSLLSGHLVRRYSNRLNPDYHPAGGFLTGTWGPLYLEAFSSDVLGARLMGAEAALDVEHLLFGQPTQRGRYTLALSAAHDWGRAEERAPSMTLAHLDGTAVVVVRPGFEAQLLAGWGARPGQGGAWGAVAGVGADAVTPTLDLRLRLEVRRQHGGFHQGAFGPDYELARFRAAGPSGLPLAQVLFPDGFSFYGETVLGWDAVRYGGLQRHLKLSLGAEAFSWGRFDVDGRLAAQLFGRNLEVAVKGLAVGMGQPGARYLGAAEVRWRLLEGRLYVLSTAGTLLYPEGGGTLRPGALASIGLGWAERPGEALAQTRDPSASSGPQPEEPQRLHRRRELREEATAVAPASAAGALGGTVPALTRETVLGAIEEVSGSTGDIAGSLPKLAGLGDRANGVFTRYVVYGDTQLQWIHGALGGATTLADAASEVADPDMEQGLLRLTGPRLEAAIFGSTLLATWVDFLNLADAVLRQCPYYGVERLYMDLDRVRKRIEPSMRALASLEPGQVEAAAIAMPELMGQLTQEFQSIREAARVANERGGQFMAAAQAMEMLTMVSTLRLSLPQMPPAAPALVGADLVMSSSGVMMGSRVVVTTEWVELMRRLVQAGVISVPVVSAAVRIHAGQVMMAQSNQELPQGVRDALGDGPEVRAMRETGKAAAGMAERPRHHVMPDESREWFEKHGFTGAMDIDQFCVELEEANHQAIHGGGDWRLGRTWPGEWNRMIMRALSNAEREAGRMLTRNEILKLVAKRMKDYNIPMNFTPWGRR